MCRHEHEKTEKGGHKIVIEIIAGQFLIILAINRKKITSDLPICQTSLDQYPKAFNIIPAKRVMKPLGLLPNSVVGSPKKTILSGRVVIVICWEAHPANKKTRPVSVLTKLNSPPFANSSRVLLTFRTIETELMTIQFSLKKKSYQRTEETSRSGTIFQFSKNINNF